MASFNVTSLFTEVPVRSRADRSTRCQDEKATNLAWLVFLFSVSSNRHHLQNNGSVLCLDVLTCLPIALLRKDPNGIVKPTILEGLQDTYPGQKPSRPISGGSVWDDCSFSHQGLRAFAKSCDYQTPFHIASVPAPRGFAGPKFYTSRRPRFVQWTGTKTQTSYN